MNPCPDCQNLHLHRVHCPSPIVLPQYAARTEAVRCPDCASLTVGEHKVWCPIVRPVKPRLLIEPQVVMAEPLEALVSDEDLEATR